MKNQTLTTEVQAVEVQAVASKVQIKAMAAFLIADNKLQNAYGAQKERAIELLQAHGYSAELDYKVNALAFKSVKKALKTALDAIEPFAIGDKSDSDKRYASLVVTLSRCSEIGRKNGKEVKETTGNVTGTRKAKTEPEAEKVIVREGIKPSCKVLTKTEAAILSETITFKGDIHAMLTKYKALIFNAIATDMELDNEYLEFRKGGTI